MDNATTGRPVFRSFAPHTCDLLVGSIANKYSLTNFVYLHPTDFEALCRSARGCDPEEKAKSGLMIVVKGTVFTCKPMDGVEGTCPQGTAAFGCFHRDTASLSMASSGAPPVTLSIFHPPVNKFAFKLLKMEVSLWNKRNREASRLRGAGRVHQAQI